MKTDNSYSYYCLGNILNNADDGFYLLIASPAMQSEVIEHYSSTPVAVEDCTQWDGEYSIKYIEKFVSGNPEASAYFFKNFQSLFFQKDKRENAVKRFNFSRDMLNSMGKVFVFCLTQEADDFLSKNAYDFYSYVRLTMTFEDSIPEKEISKEVFLEADKITDRSTGENTDISIDYSWSKEKLLALAVTLRNRGNRLVEEYKLSDGEKILNYALEIREKLLGLDNPDTANVYEDLSIVYDKQGYYGKALKAAEKALIIKENTLGKENPLTADAYSNIAGVYDDMGEYEKALEFYNKALGIVKKQLGENHPSTATTYNNIAGVYKALGEYEKALEFCNKALYIRAKQLGENHPDTATTYNNIAGVYDDQGEYEKALEFYNKALYIREKQLGENHPSTAATYNNIAGVYYHMGEYEKALEFYYKALEIVEKQLGENHPSTAATYNNIAMVYKDLGEYKKALEFYYKALEIVKKHLGENHPSTVTVRNNLDLLRKKINENQ